MDNLQYTTYPNAPKHIFHADMHYMVTASTYRKLPYLDSNQKRHFTCGTIFRMSSKYLWTLEAWCVLSDHYHFIAKAPTDASSLSQLIRSIHSISARYVNEIDRSPGRKVWFNYWDTCITYEKSYFARLHYVHTNPVKHGIAENPRRYPFCSYSWFLNNIEKDHQKNILNAPIDQLDIEF